MVSDNKRHASESYNRQKSVAVAPKTNYSPNQKFVF